MGLRHSVYGKHTFCKIFNKSQHERDKTSNVVEDRRTRSGYKLFNRINAAEIRVVLQKLNDDNEV